MDEFSFMPRISFAETDSIRVSEVNSGIPDNLNPDNSNPW